MPTQLLQERHGATLVLTLSDPATRNALSREVYADGVRALTAAAADPAIRAIVLRGEGSTFCAGGNLQRILGVRAQGEAEGRPFQAESIDRLSAWVQAMVECPKPIIAAVEGYAAGAGASLVLSCDLIVAAEDARLVMSYARIGFSPDGGGSWHLARLLPRPLALKALWLATPLKPEELLAHGVVTEVCGSGQATAQALKLAEELGRMAPNAVASVKRLVNQAHEHALPEHLAAERQHFIDNLFHPNGLEGPSAFLEKRPASFG